MTIQRFIAEHFLSLFSEVQTINQYSPKASELVTFSKRAYPDLEGGVYDIRNHDFIEVAKSSGLHVEPLPDGDARIGISKLELNANVSHEIFSKDVVCRCGFCRVTIVRDHELQKPVIKPICRSCPGGYQAPDEIQISVAIAFLQTGKTPETPVSGGALIEGAKREGFQVMWRAGGKFQLTKSSAANSNKTEANHVLPIKERRKSKEVGGGTPRTKKPRKLAA